MRPHLLLFTAVAVLLAVLAPAGHAAEWSLYGGQMITNDLPPLAFDLVTGQVRTKHSYMVGIGYSLPLPPPQWLQQRMEALGMGGFTTALDVIGVQHAVGQHNAEVDLAYTIRTPFAAYGPLRLRAGAGMGPSLALGRPSAEDGPSDTSTKRSRLQNYVGLEVEARLADVPDTGLLLRVHHRSGAYGLIAPKNVGSNFIVVGLRHNF